MSYIINLANQNADIFSEEFLEWLPDNIHVYFAFEEEAIKIYSKGFKHYSARTIVHVLRHHSAISELNGEWKINNNHSPYLARLFDLQHPAIAGMFEYRITLKSKTQRINDDEQARISDAT